MHSKVARMQSPFTRTEAYDVHLVCTHLKIITYFVPSPFSYKRKNKNSHKTSFNMICIPNCIFYKLATMNIWSQEKSSDESETQDRWTFLPRLKLCQWAGWTYPGCCCHRCLLFSSCFCGHWSSSLVSDMNRKAAQLSFKFDSIKFIPLTTLT